MNAHIPDIQSPSAFFCFLEILQQLTKRHDLFFISDLASDGGGGMNPIQLIQQIQQRFASREEWQEDQSDTLSEDQFPRSDQGRLHVAIFPCTVGFSLVYRFGYIHPDHFAHADVGTFHFTLVSNPQVFPAQEQLVYEGTLHDRKTLMEFTMAFLALCHSCRLVATRDTQLVDAIMNRSDELVRAEE